MIKNVDLNLFTTANTITISIIIIEKFSTLKKNRVIQVLRNSCLVCSYTIPDSKFSQVPKEKS